MATSLPVPPISVPNSLSKPLNDKHSISDLLHPKCLMAALAINHNQHTKNSIAGMDVSHYSSIDHGLQQCSIRSNALLLGGWALGKMKVYK